MSESETSLKARLTVWFLACGIVPMAVVAVIGYVIASGALNKVESLGEEALADNAHEKLVSMRDTKVHQLEDYLTEWRNDLTVLSDLTVSAEREAISKLTAVRDIKRKQLEAFFSGCLVDVRLLAGDPSVKQAFLALDARYDAEGGEAGGRFKGLGRGQFEAPATYRETHDTVLPVFDRYTGEHAYGDLILMCADHGDLLFSAAKNAEFGRRMGTIDSSLRDAWRGAKRGEATIVDMRACAASDGRPRMFVAAPIKEGEALLGVVALEIPTDLINALMHERAGMGETGETYLVGPDGLMRSDSVLDPTTHSVVASFADPEKGKVDTDASKPALAGETGVGFVKDYLDTAVLSAYAPVSVGHVTWAILAEIDVAEALCLRNEDGVSFFDDYRTLYGYRDVFLIEDDGYCFYTAVHDDDYQSNFVNGKYKDSGLGQLVQEVRRTKRFGFADFSPYAPSGGDPEAFMALPVLNAAGKVDLIVALQLSVESVSTMMASGADDAQALGAYLVGPDRYLRSNTELDHTPMTVANSMAKEVKMTSPTVAAALKGTTGEDIIALTVEGAEQRIFSAYAPVDVFGVRWALLCEVDEHVAMAAVEGMAATGATTVHRMRAVTIAIGCIALVLVGCIGFTIARNIANQLARSDAEIQKGVWIKTGQAELNDQIRGDLGLSTLLNSAVTRLTEYTGAHIGAIYLSEDETLKLVSSYAFSKRKKLSNVFKLGEGLVGQAALEKKRIALTDVPDDYIAVRSGLGEASPRNIIVQPLLHEGEIKGVVELGSLSSFSDSAIEYLELSSEGLSIAIHAAQSRQKVQELLEQTQEQAEELEAQQEELRQSNEELEEQAKSLQESEERLRTQQEELEETNMNLEERTESLEKERSRVEDQNLDLTEARNRIEQKAKELAITSKYKSEFLANMSHELRTPLNSMLILSKLLADNKHGHLVEKEVEFALTISNSGAELLNLINEILDLSKVEAGKIELNVEDVDLARFLGDLERSFKHTAQDKELEFTTKIDPGVAAAIRTDEQRLGQIMKNLLSNAFKFTETGSVRVRIDPATSGPHAVRIAVVDTGLGIPKEKQQLIFEAFQQADGTTSRKHGGTGLGLSISRELAKLLGGEIQLESEPDKGCTFTLLLPASVDMPEWPTTRGLRDRHRTPLGIRRNARPRRPHPLRPLRCHLPFPTASRMLPLRSFPTTARRPRRMTNRF
jgi:signal transduction histidine kinase